MIKFTFLFIILGWFLVRTKSQKYIDKYVIMCGVLFTCMIGLRNEVIFGDTYGYVYTFKELNTYTFKGIFDNIDRDPSFWGLSYILYHIFSGNYTLWLSIFAIAIMVPFIILVKRYSVDPMYSWILFVFLGFMYFFMAGLRQTLALAICLSAFHFLLDNERKNSKLIFTILVVFASFFHGSSLICLLGLLFKNRAINKGTIVLYFAILLISFIYGRELMPYVTSFIGQYDERYIGYGENLKGSNLTYFIQQVIVILPSIYYLRNRFKEPLISTLFHISILGLIFISLSIVIAEMFRVSYYFSWANLLLFPMAIKEMRRQNPYIPFVFLAFFILYLVFINGAGWMDYYFWFEDTSSIATMFDTSEM